MATRDATPTLEAIDEALGIERGAWKIEQRAGDHCAAANRCLTVIDSLLSRRTVEVRRLQDVERRPPAGPRMRSQP